MLSKSISVQRVGNLRVLAASASNAAFHTSNVLLAQPSTANTSASRSDSVKPSSTSSPASTPQNSQTSRSGTTYPASSSSSNPTGASPSSSSKGNASNSSPSYGSSGTSGSTYGRSDSNSRDTSSRSGSNYGDTSSRSGSSYNTPSSRTPNDPVNDRVMRKRMLYALLVLGLAVEEVTLGKISGMLSSRVSKVRTAPTTASGEKSAADSVRKAEQHVEEVNARPIDRYSDPIEARKIKGESADRPLVLKGESVAPKNAK